MSGVSLKMERTRNGLSEVILGELHSWPDLHRRIFVQSHYRGQSVELVSRCLGVCASEVRLVLQQCERRLRTALKAFRESSVDSSTPPGITPRMAAPNGHVY